VGFSPLAAVNGTLGTRGLRLWKRDRLLEGFQADQSSAAQWNCEAFIQRLFCCEKRFSFCWQVVLAGPELAACFSAQKQAPSFSSHRGLHSQKIKIRGKKKNPNKKNPAQTRQVPRDFNGKKGKGRKW